MILVQGGRMATGTELDGRPVGPRGRRMLSDRRASAARRRRRRAEHVARSASRPPLDEVTAGLAHDLNNRLSVILGQAQLLRRGTVDAGAGARRLEKIEEETMRASRMTRGLLDLARREAPAHMPVAINTLVPRALAIAHGKLRGTRIEVTTRLTAAAPLVRGDAAQLTQVLVHLIDNAIEAMGESGQLTVTTAITDDGLEVTVSDTGAGMLPDEAHRIFEPFYTTKQDGEGLGLFHTLTVLKAHGGSVAVDTAPGCGTTMCVRLSQALSVAGVPRIDRA